MSIHCNNNKQFIYKKGGFREMAAIKEGGVTQNESLLPKFLHKKGG